ncbi:opioid growth factor receptor conserved region-domain-containing protein [Rhodofomes roseus]|uniref:Opioid growth factor receptor conserved region-domain-containing protein n=1 Tax=Rhodofomes roseus TaxID=34475 RepID=A0ABQ8KSK8_9APHY|nr:opioid growth factor receptor conserved region-domain-containing protein [Rhodofomes roseus]KAH9841805.1 opioid growth factor receptor conserved region-domain-containing protein [Rhodofomes roseus]
MSASIPRDVREFLDDYPDNNDDPSCSDNLLFYSNKSRCQPDNLYIDDLHKQWRGDYAKLEYKHGFIQWLFPIPEHGMNWESQPLQRHEVEAMKADETIVERVLRSYRLMLDFYGMRLEDSETGLLARSDKNWKDRFRNLTRSSHNYLRISRILKCLSMLGLERLNAGFLLFVLAEQSEHGELNTAGIRSSMDRWWANCVRNEEERKWIGEMIRNVRERERGEFTRELYTEALRRRKETGKLAEEASAVDAEE